MIASLTQFERFAHLAYYPLAGGDKASKEAIRPALSLLKQAYGEEFGLEDFRWLLSRIEPDENKRRFIFEQIEKRVNTVNTSSLGRIFDAVAACLGLGSYNHFDAQLPMALESVADADCADGYEFDLHEENDKPLQLDLRRTLRGIVADLKRDVPPAIVSARFHNTLAEALLALAQKAREKTRLDVVALSGGVFCNRHLLNRLVKRLKEDRFTVLLNRAVPSNDGGIALGQAAIAAALCRSRT